MVLVYVPNDSGGFYDRAKEVARGLYPNETCEARNPSRTNVDELEFKGVAGVIAPPGFEPLLAHYDSKEIPTHILPFSSHGGSVRVRKKKPDVDHGAIPPLTFAPRLLVDTLYNLPTDKLRALIPCLHSPTLLRALIGEMVASEDDRTPLKIELLKRLSEAEGTDR